MKAWYFAPPTEVLGYGDGRKIQVGKMHTVKGRPEVCSFGLHGSVRLLDALGYAKSPILYLVNISRNVDSVTNKIAGQRRKYIARIDAEEILWKFARKQALINVTKIQPYCSLAEYKLILKYLNTGQSKSAAESAARSAAESAAWSAAGSAAESAAWSAAGSAARSAAWSAAWSAAESAARSAAWSAAWSAQNKMLTNMVMEELRKQGYTE
jgi:hypothetical protein